jgi:ABC-type transporter MlaC component
MRVLFVAFLTFALVWGAEAAVAEEDAGSAIRDFVSRVNQASEGFFSSGSEADARERCRALLAWAFDVPAMAKEAFGGLWDQISEQQQKELMAAFEQDIISAYLRRMRPGGTTLAFVGQRPPVDGDQFAASRRSVNGKEDQTWIWRLRSNGQSWRIIDVMLNGRSAVSAAKQEYASVLKSNNNDINALIAFMHKRAAQ